MKTVIALTLALTAGTATAEDCTGSAFDSADCPASSSAIGDGNTKPTDVEYWKYYEYKYGDGTAPEPHFVGGAQPTVGDVETNSGHEYWNGRSLPWVVAIRYNGMATWNTPLDACLEAHSMSYPDYTNYGIRIVDPGTGYEWSSVTGDDYAYLNLMRSFDSSGGLECQSRMELEGYDDLQWRWTKGIRLFNPPADLCEQVAADEQVELVLPYIGGALLLNPVTEGDAMTWKAEHYMDRDHCTRGSCSEYFHLDDIEYLAQDESGEVRLTGVVHWAFVANNVLDSSEIYQGWGCLEFND